MEGKNWKFEFEWEDRYLYTVKVNGEVIMECAGEEDLKDVTVKDMIQFYKEAHDWRVK